MGERQRRTALFAICGVLILVAGGMYVFRSQTTIEAPTRANYEGVCLACKQPASGSYPINERPPLVCPSCSERAVSPWFYCLTCEKRFVPAYEVGPNGPKLPMIPTCPCGQSGSQWLPQLFEEEPKGDAELPPWPPQ